MTCRHERAVSSTTRERRRFGASTKLVCGVLASAAGAMVGCKGFTDCPSPCPDPFLLSAWCAQTHACRVDGIEYLGDLPGHQTLEIPFAQFATALQGRDLQLFPKEMHGVLYTVALDGEVATLWPPPPPILGGGVARWSTFPENAQTLTIVIEAAGIERGLGMEFIDYPCEVENPRIICPQ